MNREEARADLLRFLRTIQRPDAPIEELDEHASLVDSGLIDSLAVMQIIAYLEERHGIELAASGFDPADLGSVTGILGLIGRRRAG